MLRLQPGEQRERGSRAAEGGEMVAPKILGYLANQRALVRRELGVRRGSALKRALTQDTLAEAVDGRDARLIEIAGGVRQPLAHAFLALMARDQFGNKGRFRRSSVEHGHRLGESGADALAQFLGGGNRVGGHGNLPHGESLLGDEAEVDRGECIGLARSRAGLQQRDARFQRRIE